MADPQGRDVVPDDSLLRRIFAHNQPLSVSIILNNWDKCVFKATVPNALSNGCYSCIVRLEALNNQAATFFMVAAMQEIAALCIPDFVPETLDAGKAANEKGREFQFSVLEFIEGVTLEDAWELMADTNRRSVVNTIVKVLSELQSVEISDWKAQNLLQISLGEESREKLANAVLGGPSTGLLIDGRSLLSSMEQQFQLKKPFHTTRPMDNPRRLVIESEYEEVGSATVGDADMEEWSKEAVFCHNDLEPRNIMVRAVEAPGGQTKYELAALIDWELAGFYPPSYQLSLQDTYLGTGHRHLSFYFLLKEGLQRIVPRSPSQVSLSRAMLLLFESQQQMLSSGRNVGAHILRHYRKIMQLSRDEDPYVGWRCDAEGPLPEMSADDFDKLENEVIADVLG
ncbi:hypothetical protein B0T21DRAFT_389188 [Apiosordaria backusii]|uniref:Aminoglycoside phosphotransferase domain-containing protein n=1 Tax=Apiosordaria backusii TaxID=314023 RepID=A0AA40EZ85_9PEZI|nr:hypothetical protein B0T21DRAFT_389188 [Apiosordaria backusii]